MNLFSFTANFTNEESCRQYFKSERDKQGLKCKVCGISNITGYKPDGVTSVKNAIIRPPFAAVQLWKILIFLF